MKRRDFLQRTSVSAAALALLPGATSCLASNGISKAYGLQVYTLRDAIQKDFKGTLKRVADIGYNYIELFDYQNGQYFGNSIQETKKIITDLGLKVRSSHILLGKAMADRKGTMMNDWERTVADAAELGQEYIVCAYLFDNERESIDDYKRYVDLFNEKGEIAKKHGLQFAYHNHDFEFIKMDGQVPYDLLLNNCDKDLVKFEMDLYWMHRAKQDPVAYFEKHSGRFPLWHVKDMTGDEEQFFAPVGKGVIDWKRIFNHADKAGMKYFFVEQDQSRNNKPFDNIATSLKYLKSM